MSQKKMYRKRTALLMVLLALIAGRIYLPFWVTDYVNKVLDEIPDHQGHITDVHISLLRGAYVIDSLVIENIEGEEPLPFVNIPKIDLSVEWDQLWQGAIVGEVYLERPELYLTITASGQEAYGDDVDWTEPLKELMPLSINRLEANNGQVIYRDESASPPVKFDLHQLQLEATNLSNTYKKDVKLPSHAELHATSIGNGQLTVTGDLNVLKLIPDMDIDVKFENADLVAMNNALQAYMGIDAERGKISTFAEIALEDGRIKGYVKPVIEDLKILNWSNDKKKPLQMIWETLAGAVLEIFENQPNDQIATKVPFEGDLNDPTVKVFPTIWNVLRNAFFGAFKKDVDGTISLKEPDPTPDKKAKE